MIMAPKLTGLFFVLVGLVAQLTVLCEGGRRHHHRDHHKTNRIIDGVEASEGEFPEHVAIEIPLSNSKTGACGGVLIHSDIVLTAGHCLKRVVNIESMNVSNSINAPLMWTKSDRQQARRVKAACISDKYSTDGKVTIYDYGVVVLEKKFDNYRKAKLESKDPKVGTTGIATGMGLTHYDRNNPKNNVLAKKLRKLEMEVIECSEQNQHKTNICFTSKYGGDVCYGDSGSPVFSKDHKVLGLSSHINAPPNQPAERCIPGFKGRSVFADITRNRKLIDKLVKDCRKNHN